MPFSVPFVRATSGVFVFVSGGSRKSWDLRRKKNILSLAPFAFPTLLTIICSAEPEDHHRPNFRSVFFPQSRRARASRLIDDVLAHWKFKVKVHSTTPRPLVGRCRMENQLETIFMLRVTAHQQLAWRGFPICSASHR